MENKINFGELDTLVLLRSCVITYGTQGAKKYTFQDYERVYAKVDRNVAENVTNTNPHHLQGEGSHDPLAGSRGGAFLRDHRHRPNLQSLAPVPPHPPRC